MRKLLLLALLTPSLALGQEVTVETFVRAESDHMIRANMANGGFDVGRLAHGRETTTPETQAVIRSNHPGWNYLIRMYEPREEILEGRWSFPAIVPTR
ncbi:MAG: hypothetical protein R3195_18510 [Gemmatimonadota bacterium]|nr:hypothetical protein [Gemmatimonadota bacterium]